MSETVVLLEAPGVKPSVNHRFVTETNLASVFVAVVSTAVYSAAENGCGTTLVVVRTLESTFGTLLTLFTHSLVLVTAVDTVSHRIAEGVLRQTLSTLTPETLVVAGYSFVAPGFVTAVGTLPSSVADRSPGQTSTIVTGEGR